MNKTLTIQTRIDEQLLQTLHKLCELRGQSIAEYLRNALREAMANEKDVYKQMLNKKIRLKN